MNYSNEEIVRQLRLGEDSYWEFKQIEFSGNRPKSPNRNDLADEIAAFANTRGGVLLCSVTDKGEVRDMSREQLEALDSLLAEASTDSIKPPIRVVTCHTELPNGKTLLLLEVPEGHTQHDSPGGSFTRVGGSKRRMTSDERLRLAQLRGQARFVWFDKQTVPDTGFATLDESLWKPLLSSEWATEPELGLTNSGLLAFHEPESLRCTVAGILLCTRNPEKKLPCACITATRYRGKDRASSQVDSQEIVGPLNRQIADAMSFAVRNMHVAARKEPARVDLPQYSERALFEALVNAVAHRDYAIGGSKIRLSMFENRLEIQSPGSLPNNLTIDSMSTRQATRNETLTSVLGRMPVGGVQGSQDRQYYMERRGDGVQIIRRETRELCGIEPEYRLIDESEVLLKIPAASLEPSPAHAVITVRTSGQPLPGAQLLVLFPNKTWKQAASDENGEAVVDLHTTHLPMTVFVAARGYAARLEQDWIPSRGALAVAIQALPSGGSAIFSEATGHLPGLKGRLNPIRDTHDRMYLYASNIAINAGRQQPVHFLPGEDMRLTDSDGRDLLVRVVDIVGRSALLEYGPIAKRA